MKNWDVFSFIDKCAAANFPHFSLETAAQQYALAGFDVCAADKRGKRPIVRRDDGWIPSESPGLLQKDSISSWDDNDIHGDPEFNIGILTGGDFWVLDIDGEPGQQSMKWFKHYLGFEPRTLTMNTGNGQHAYFKKDPLMKIPTTIGLLPGLDVRGENGMVIVPPSIHSTGKRYSMQCGVRELNYAPLFLTELAENAEEMILPWNIANAQQQSDEAQARMLSKGLAKYAADPQKIWDATMIEFRGILNQ